MALWHRAAHHAPLALSGARQTQYKAFWFPHEALHKKAWVGFLNLSERRAQVALRYAEAQTGDRAGESVVTFSVPARGSVELPIQNAGSPRNIVASSSEPLFSLACDQKVSVSSRLCSTALPGAPLDAHQALTPGGIRLAERNSDRVREIASDLSRRARAGSASH
jgi:hypothetical protein